MRPSVQGRRGWAVPLLASLAVHGCLLLILCCAPSHGRLPALSIESTRVALDTCVFDLASPARPSPLPSSGAEVSVDLHPQLIEAPAVSAEAIPAAGPQVLSIPGPCSGNPHAGSPSGRASAGGPAITGSLFPLPPTAASVVYVLDRSVSMGMNNKLDLACRELLASLRCLPPTTRFQVIAYNTYAEPLVINGRTGLLPAEPAIVEQVAHALDKLTASGDTQHANALRRGLMLHPDVLFFITDADDLTSEQVEHLTRCNQGTTVHAIELTQRRNPRLASPLAQLARNSGGGHRQVWTGE